MSAGYVESLFTLSGRIALVTGASSGLGRHMAETLCLAGACVVLLARREDRLREAVEEITAKGGKCASIVCDLASEEDWAGLAAKVTEPFGAPDILINAAGINLRIGADDITVDEWNRTLHLNLSVPFFMAQALVPGMRDRKMGNIINIASLQSFRAFENGISYGASKGGITQLTRAMAEAWSRDGITANAIAPGFFPTELTAGIFANDEMREHHARATTIGRNGEMADMNGTTVFLASRASAYVTGQVIAVDGGYLAT